MHAPNAMPKPGVGTSFPLSLKNVGMLTGSMFATKHVYWLGHIKLNGLIKSRVALVLRPVTATQHAAGRSLQSSNSVLPTDGRENPSYLPVTNSHDLELA